MKLRTRDRFDLKWADGTMSRNQYLGDYKMFFGATKPEDKKTALEEWNEFVEFIEDAAAHL